MYAQPGTRTGLNPIARLAALVSTCVVAFRARTPLQAAALFCAILLMHAAMGAPLGQSSFRRRLRRIFVFAAVLFAGQVLLTHGSELAQRVTAGALMSLRFLNVVLASHLFVSTTEPQHLAYAMMQAGLPYRYGFAFLAAMRFVPYFRDQAQTVRHAQMARGIAVDRPTPRSVFLMARCTFVPVVVSALGRVESLAVSMEGRCFGLHPTRTFRRRIPLGAVDALAIAASAAVTAFALAAM